MKKFTKAIEMVLFVMALCACLFAAGCGKNGEVGSDKPGTDAPEVTDSDTEKVGIDDYQNVYDDKGNLIGREGYYTNGVLRYKETLDKKGNTTESVLYNSDGAVNAEEKYTYDGDGKIVQITTKKNYYENGQLKEYNISYFNENTWCIGSYSYNADGSSQGFTTYEYDEAGNVTREKVFSEKTTLKYAVVRDYEDETHPNLPTKETMEDDRGNITSVALMEYNENGTIKRRSECNTSGDVTSYCDYVYGDDGKLAEEQVYVSDGNGGFYRYN